MTDTAEPHFADLFPRADEAQWRALAARALKGAPFETLVSRTADNIAIEPLYQSLKAERPRALRAAPGGWAVAARADHPDPSEANAQALADLEGGANAMHLVFQGSAGACGFGLPPDAAALEAALEGVHLDLGVKIELDMSFASAACAGALAAMIEARKIDPAGVSISFGFDPLSQWALRGVAPASWEETARALAQTSSGLAARGFTGRFCAADGRAVHAGGGTEAQELAFAVGAALAYWRALEAGGFSHNAARDMISFRMAADADEFLTIAKFRALRRLWAGVEAAAGLSPKPIHIHSETAWRMMTRRDPHVNILRATVACFSAGLGGADVVSVLPFTQALGLPDAQARRIARNTQLVLLEEAGLGRVEDPAAGSGLFEALTDGLCARAWTLVQENERAGGLHAALASGAFQHQVFRAREARREAAATRRAPLTGTSEFADWREARVDVLAPVPASILPAGVTAFPALAPSRDGGEFEAIRDAADARAKRPSVFIANLGAPAAFSARAAFAAGLFAAGGVEAPGNEGFADDAALAAAFHTSGAMMACLCSSDEIYAARAASASQALKAAGARHVWLAGRQGARGAEFQAAGIDGFIYAGCDVIAALREALACV